MRKAPARRGQRGQAALETGLMLPVIFLLLVLVVGSGTMIGEDVRLSEAAREASGAAATATRCLQEHPGQSAVCTYPSGTAAACAAVVRAMGASAGTCNGGGPRDARVSVTSPTDPTLPAGAVVDDVRVTLDVPVALIATGTISAAARGTACLTPSLGPTCAPPPAQLQLAPNPQ